MSILGLLAAGLIGAALLSDDENPDEEYDQVKVPDETDYDKQWVDLNYYQIDDDWEDK